MLRCKHRISADAGVPQHASLATMARLRPATLGTQKKSVLVVQRKTVSETAGPVHSKTAIHTTIRCGAGVIRTTRLEHKRNSAGSMAAMEREDRAGCTRKGSMLEHCVAKRKPPDSGSIQQPLNRESHPAQTPSSTFMVFFRPTPSWLPPGRSTRSIACCKLGCKG